MHTSGVNSGIALPGAAATIRVSDASDLQRRRKHQPEDRPRQDDRHPSSHINVIKRHFDTVAQTFANFCPLLDGNNLRNH